MKHSNEIKKSFVLRSGIKICPIFFGENKKNRHIVLDFYIIECYYMYVVSVC